MRRRESDSAQQILTAIKTNIAWAQHARALGTTATLVPILAHYVSDQVLPPPMTADSFAHELPQRTAQDPMAEAFHPDSEFRHCISRSLPCNLNCRPAGSTQAVRPSGDPDVILAHFVSKALLCVTKRMPTRNYRHVHKIAFILFMNFDHQPISQTKKEFGECMEVGPNILHYRRMSLQGS